MKNNRKKRNSSRKKSRRISPFRLIIPVAVLIVIVFAAVTIYRVSNVPTVTGDGIDYSIRGVDVSAYQGEVDWETIADQNMAFAFIKATEGSDHVDEYFQTNWKEAHKTDLRVGAYHFMSFDTSGEEQAQNFIETVEKERGMLPPVIDLELYGEYVDALPDAETVWGILDPLMEALEDHYGQKPIIYTTNHLYNIFITERYDNDIWIADPEMKQPLDDGNTWTFCQYDIEGELEGYRGPVEHIDLNVYRGTKLTWVFY